MSIFSDSRRYADDERYEEWKSEVAWEMKHEMRFDDDEPIPCERCETCRACIENDDGQLICTEYEKEFEVESKERCELWEEK